MVTMVLLVSFRNDNTFFLCPWTTLIESVREGVLLESLLESGSEGNLVARLSWISVFYKGSTTETS